MRIGYLRWRICLLTAAAVLFIGLSPTRALAYLPGGSMDPTTIQKFVERLDIPPAMLKSGTIGSKIDYYEIAVRQFKQQLLPTGMPQTTVWGYGSKDNNGFHYPASTIEAKVGRAVRVKWINDLKDEDGTFLPHLLPVDQTLFWANPGKDCIDGLPRTDCMGQSQAPYAGPVPIVTHLHGAHVEPQSDGFPEAWYLPDANNLPAGFATQGSHFGQISGVPVEAGAAVFQYRNDQRATTLWFHDHSLGMTRVNVYAGLAGFYLLRGGSADLPAGVLPGPAPAPGDLNGKRYYEIPLVIQDKSFNADGSLFYPDNRAFFEGLNPYPISPYLNIPFIPDPAFGGMSDASPIFNPEFFGNTMVVNGRTWPYLNVEQRRYRFRILNASDTRVLILKFSSALTFWQIGADGGFLPNPVQLSQLLIAPAERVDVIVDFTSIPADTSITLLNIGPDEPFGGGIPGVDFASADPATTGQVMQFRVVTRVGNDTSTPPASLKLPSRTKLGSATNTRKVSLNEAESSTVLVVTQPDGSVVFDPTDRKAVPFGPIHANLGTVNPDGTGNPLEFTDPITENPALGSTEIWEIRNFTEDAHPIHVHQVEFEILDRTPFGQKIGGPKTRKAESWETGIKDTVISYPGEITRIKAKYDLGGLYIWHCHILSHEDNEMMRPFCVGDLANCQ